MKISQSRFSIHLAQLAQIYKPGISIISIFTPILFFFILKKLTKITKMTIRTKLLFSLKILIPMKCVINFPFSHKTLFLARFHLFEGHLNRHECFRNIETRAYSKW